LVQLHFEIGGESRHVGHRRQPVAVLFRVVEAVCANYGGGLYLRARDLVGGLEDVCGGQLEEPLKVVKED